MQTSASIKWQMYKIPGSYRAAMCVVVVVDVVCRTTVVWAKSFLWLSKISMCGGAESHIEGTTQNECVAHVGSSLHILRIIICALRKPTHTHTERRDDTRAKTIYMMMAYRSPKMLRAERPVCGWGCSRRFDF